MSKRLYNHHHQKPSFPHKTPFPPQKNFPHKKNHATIQSGCLRHLTQNSLFSKNHILFFLLKMKPFFKNFGRFFVLFLAAFFLWAAANPHLFTPTNAASNRPKVSDQTLINLSNACRNGSQIICRGITRKSDSRAKKFTETEIHGKKYTITNYSENDIFLPMKTQHEWERVICAASQGDKNRIDCSDTNEFGGPSMGFPHSNGREAADPFSGKDLNTFEYERETGPSLGIKIDLIAEWLVTQARGCPTSCGNSARNFSGSVSCSTGDENDCDPSTKPAIPTRSCGKTADCPTYTGTWIKGSCPSGCGQSRGWKTVSVSCSGGNCNPSTKPSTSRYCGATSACYTGSWQTTQPSCPTYCGFSGGVRYGSVSCVGGNCNPSTKPSAPSRYCSRTGSCAPTYTGTWVRGSCPSGCGQSAGYKTVSVTCSGGNCNPSTKPSTSRYCGATSACYTARGKQPSLLAPPIAGLVAEYDTEA